MPVQGNFNTIYADVCVGAEDFRSLVIEKLYKRIGVGEVLTLVAPVRNGSNIPRLSYDANYNSIKFTDGDDCAIDTCDFSPTWANKQWIIKEAECRYEECMKGLDDKFMQLYNHYKRLNPDSDEYQFVIDQITDMLADILANSLLAKVWLSDTENTEDTINGLDGVIAQLKTEQNLAYDLPQDQELTGEEWYEHIGNALEMYEDQEFGDGTADPVIYMDTQDARKLVRWLNAQDRTKINCECIDPDGVVRGDRFTVEGLRVHGVRVIAIPYKKMLESFPTDYFDDDAGNGGANPHWIDPNLLVITPMTNILVGNENNDDLNELTYFYNREDRKHKWDLGMRFGVTVPSPYFIHGFKNE